MSWIQNLTHVFCNCIVQKTGDQPTLTNRKGALKTEITSLLNGLYTLGSVRIDKALQPCQNAFKQKVELKYSSLKNTEIFQSLNDT